MPECAFRPCLPMVLGALLFAAIPPGGAAAQDRSLPDNVIGGWKVFNEKQCIRCHAVWGLGGGIGPDLGRTGHDQLSMSDLAGSMWNHIPRMHSHMLQNKIRYPSLTLQDMSDLFSFLYFVRHLEESGDPEVGQRLLRERGCTRCHSAEDQPPEKVRLDIRRWTTYANPIIWAQKMWEHAPQMARAMEEAGITWPQFDDTDLVNIIAYVRSLGRLEKIQYLRPGSALSGSQLFADRKCQTCHNRGGPAKDLATADLPRSIAALASRMWNHSPEMTRLMQTQGIERSKLTPQEMADIIAYIQSLRSPDDQGDAQKGRQLFVRKRCTQCHHEEARASSNAPAIETLAAAVTPVRFAHAMWNHGVPMLEVLSEFGSTWPVFQSGEVADLIAYLKSTALERMPPEVSSPVVAPAPPPAAGGAPAPPRPSTGTAIEPVAGTAAEPVIEPVMAPAVKPPARPPIQPGASCVSNACHPNLIAGREVHIPVAQGECSACHAMRSAEQHEFELLTDRSELCYRCHDEPDKAPGAHRSVSVAICTACHEPHSAESLYGPDFTGKEVCYAKATAMPPAPATRGGQPAGQAPVEALIKFSPATEQKAVAASTSLAEILGVTGMLPDVAHTAHPRAAAAPPPTTVIGDCSSAQCHVPEVSGQAIHPPAAQQQCDACHRLVDGQTHRFELTRKEPELCFQCHEQEQYQGAFIHGPVGLGLCTPCHNPHSSPHKYMLPAAGSELCFTCHSEMAGKMRAATVVHKAVSETEKGCISCHSPHRSPYKFQLWKEPPDLCYGCHQETRDVIQTAIVSHDPVSSGGKCGNCHDAHGSSVEKLLVNSEMKLCLGCHNQPLNTPRGPIIDMKSWIDANPEHHGPIREGLCTSCHMPHGSKNFRILRHEFPAEFYRPFSVETYTLCFDCHEQTIVLDAHTTTLTGFRNGDINLHYVHVNQKKGRTCRACHEIHAGTKPMRMKDFVPFGAWKYPVNFEITADGGHCAPGCHVPRAYSRLQEIHQK